MLQIFLCAALVLGGVDLILLLSQGKRRIPQWSWRVGHRSIYLAGALAALYGLWFVNAGTTAQSVMVGAGLVVFSITGLCGLAQRLSARYACQPG